MVDAEKPGVEGGSALQALDLTFSIDLSVEEGGGSVELVAAGRDTEVNNVNIYQYVRKYAEYRMVTSQEKALKKVKKLLLTGPCTALLKYFSGLDEGGSL